MNDQNCPPPKSPEDLAPAVQALKRMLEAETSVHWDTLERPHVLAALVLSSRRDRFSTRAHQLEQTLSNACGQLLVGLVQPYLTLHAYLVSQGHLDQASAMDLGRDAYLWSVADREFEDPQAKGDEAFLRSLGLQCKTPPVKVKAFVLQTQSQGFIVVLNQRSKKWSMHIRRVWEDAGAALASTDHLGALEAYRDRKDLTLADVIALVKHAQAFSDDTPGAPYPARLSLKSYLDGNMLARTEGAGRGLRYGDLRDVGYVASLDGSWDFPLADGGYSLDFEALGYLTAILAAELDELPPYAGT